MDRTCRLLGRRLLVTTAVGLLSCASLVWAQDDPVVTTPAAALDVPWVCTWSTAPSAAVFDGSVVNTAYRGNNVFSEQTLRLIVHTSVGGRQVRLRLSNEFGTAPLAVGAVHVAQSDGGAGIVSGTDRAVTVGGRVAFTIPAGGPVVSDPVKLDVPPDANLAVSIYLAGSTNVLTSHGGIVQSNYVSAPGSGDLTSADTLPVDPSLPVLYAWPLLTGVDVRAKGTSVFVALGASISSGIGSTLDANHRWTDYLSQRLARKHLPISVVNPSIAANRLQLNSAGQNALARFDRDVLAQPGVKYVLVTDAAGVDLINGARNPSQDPSVDDEIWALKQLITRSHSRGIKIFAGTLLPLGGSTLETDASRAKRLAVNAWIRSGAFDGVADFEQAVADPADPNRILPALDSGDHHHPNDEGYRLMAKTVDPAWFRP